MDLILNTVLKSIDGNPILNIGNLEQNFKRGSTAMNAIDPVVVYVIQKQKKLELNLLIR